MKKYVFKTNINCSGCVAKVKPFLDEVPEIQHWEVNTDDPDKILEVSTPSLSEAAIIEKVEAAGFTLTPRKAGLLKRWLR